MAYAGDGVHEGDGEGGELFLGPDAGKKEEAGCIDCAGAEDRFFAGVEGEGCTGLQG